MDNSTAQSVKEAFGTDFAKYCSRHKIELEKDKCGAFVAPNVHVLAECMEVINGFKDKTNRRLKSLQRSILPPKKFNHLTQKTRQQCNVNQMQGQNSQKSPINYNWFLNDIEIDAYLCNSVSVLPNYKRPTNTPKCIFNTGKSSAEIYNFIINDFMKKIIITDYEGSISKFCSLLDAFQKKHKRFHYYTVLKHINQDRENKENLECKENPKYKKALKYKENPKCKFAMSREQLRRFFDLIFSKVVPLQIFGKLKNLKRIKKAMFHLLDAPSFKSFNLKPYIEHLDITCIDWLGSIRNIKTRWLIMVKFVKWFFVAFLFKILHTYFHITVTGSSTERVYILCLNWNDVQRKFIKRKIKTSNLQPNVSCNDQGPSIGVYKLIPKCSNIRPIFKPDNPDADKNHFYILLKFLKQLYATKYGVTNFQKKWQSIIQDTSNSKEKPLYLVSCDVTDAFGSVKHDILYNIIQSLCEDLPENLILKCYVIKSLKFKENDICYRQFFSDPNLLLPFAPDTLFAYTQTNICQWIKKSWLLERIKKCIFLQRVKIGEKIYIIGRGLVQGTMLSPILSDIYYNFILHKEMAEFLKAGEIIKYMDDILYVTDNEILAKEFLKVTKKGFQQYHCYFKRSKTQCNVTYEGYKLADTITFIGHKINCINLEVEPKYSNTKLHYIMSFTSKLDETPIQLLKNRLNNLAALRISKIMFDKAVNSKKTLIKILVNLSLVQAKRAYALIKELFNNVPGNVRNILQIIKESNDRIARHIIKFLLIYQEKMSRTGVYTWNNRIQYSLWTSYKKVFTNDPLLQQYFAGLFQVVINNIPYFRCYDY